MSKLTHLECSKCGEHHDADQVQTVCKKCGKPLFARYDLEAAKETLNEAGACGQGLLDVEV